MINIHRTSNMAVRRYQTCLRCRNDQHRSAISGCRLTGKKKKKEEKNQHEDGFTQNSNYRKTLNPSKHSGQQIPPRFRFKSTTFRPRCGYVCFVWISEQIAIISLQFVNSALFTTEAECLLRGTNYMFQHTSGLCWSVKCSRMWIRSEIARDHARSRKSVESANDDDWHNSRRRKGQHCISTKT